MYCTSLWSCLDRGSVYFVLRIDYCAMLPFAASFILVASSGRSQDVLVVLAMGEFEARVQGRGERRTDLT
jgi:hypothetical protein